VSASERAQAAGLTVLQSARRREAKEAAESTLSNLQRAYTRRVEAYPRRQAKRIPEEERDRVQRRLANATELVAVYFAKMVSLPVLPWVYAVLMLACS
jgi:hypothetical protein